MRVNIKIEKDIRVKPNILNWGFKLKRQINLTKKTNSKD